MRPTFFTFGLVCHTALDAASSICFSGFLLEFIPMKIGAEMTNIVKGFMTRYGKDGNRARRHELWIFVRFADSSVIVNTKIDVTVNMINQFEKHFYYKILKLLNNKFLVHFAKKFTFLLKFLFLGSIIMVNF
jgi:hypothetical protein